MAIKIYGPLGCIMDEQDGTSKAPPPLKVNNMNYWTYEESKAYMKSNCAEIKTKAQFVRMMQGRAIGYLPLRPNKAYKGNGWISWEDFLNK